MNESGGPRCGHRVLTMSAPGGADVDHDGQVLADVVADRQQDDDDDEPDPAGHAQRLGQDLLDVHGVNLLYWGTGEGWLLRRSL